MKDFFEDQEQYDQLPLLYRKLEQFTDDVASTIKVEDLNMMPADFYQTSKISVGFFFKKPAHVLWDKETMLFSQL